MQEWRKTVRSDTGKLELNIPRDRNSEYKPQLIPKGEYSISGIDDKIISIWSSYNISYNFHWAILTILVKITQ